MMVSAKDGDELTLTVICNTVIVIMDCYGNNN